MSAFVPFLLRCLGGEPKEGVRRLCWAAEFAIFCIGQHCCPNWVTYGAPPQDRWAGAGSAVGGEGAPGGKTSNQSGRLSGTKVASRKTSAPSGAGLIRPICRDADDGAKRSLTVAASGPRRRVGRGLGRIASTTMDASGFGLFDPALEKDSCGVGFIADIKGRKSHKIVEDALTILRQSRTSRRGRRRSARRRRRRHPGADAAQVLRQEGGRARLHAAGAGRIRGRRAVHAARRRHGGRRSWTLTRRSPRRKA